MKVKIVFSVFYSCYITPYIMKCMRVIVVHHGILSVERACPTFHLPEIISAVSKQ